MEETVIIRKETYDNLMDIEMKKLHTIDKLRDNIKELESGCVSVQVKYRETMFFTEKEINLLTNDERVKLIKDEIKQDHASIVDEIYNRNIF